MHTSDGTIKFARLLSMIGIIGAMDEEVKQLNDTLVKEYERDIAGTTMVFGRLENRDVLLAKCGIGKVNAGALTTLMANEGVKKLIFTGVAGALEPDLKVGDIIISLDAMQHDVDVRGLGYDIAQIPGEPLAWAADDSLMQAAFETAQTLDDIHSRTGRILSGDSFIHDAAKVKQLYHDYNASCVEMEGAAMAQIAEKWGIPWVIIRSISDTADGQAKVDFRRFTSLAATRSAFVVRGMLRRMAA